MLTRTSRGAPRATQRFRAILTILAAMLLALGASACGADDPNVQSHVALAKTYVTLTPNPTSVKVGATVTFQGTITAPDGSQSAVGSDLAAAAKPTWSSSRPEIATVDATGVATGVSAGATTITVTLPDGVTIGVATLTVTAIPLTNLTAMPPTASVPVGTKQTFTINAVFADGTSADLTKGVVWSTSDPTIATVDPVKGTIDAISPGTVTITATDPATGKTATATLTIVAITLKSLAVSPATTTLPVPARQAFHAIGTYSDGSTHDISNSVAWSSDTPAALTIDAASGLGTAVAQGTAKVTATASTTPAITATATVNVASLTSLSVTPPTASLVLGHPVTLAAIGTFTDASMHDITNAVVWSTADPTIATVDGAGNVASVGVGTVKITATDSTGTQSASSSITVTQAVLVAMTLQASPNEEDAPRPTRGPTPLVVTPTEVMAMGGPGFNLTITGVYSDGSTAMLDSTQYTVVQSPTGIVDLEGTNVYPSAQGFTTLTFTSTDDTTIGAMINFVVTPPALEFISLSLADTEGYGIPYGPTLTTQVLAMGYFSDGSRTDITSTVTWASGAPANVSITSTGLASGLVGNSSATITATDPTTGIVGSATLNVGPAPIASIAVSPGSQSVTAGAVAAFTAMGTYADGTTGDVTTLVDWTSSDTTVASNPSYVTGNPTHVTAPRPATSGKSTLAPKRAAPPISALSTTYKAGGPITITATDPATGVAGTATLTVTAATLASLTPTSPLTTLYSGLTGFALSVTGTNSDGSSVPFASLPPLTWSITSGTGATIDPTTGALTTSNTTAAVTTIVVNVLDPVSGATGNVSINVDPRTITGFAVTPDGNTFYGSYMGGPADSQQMAATLTLSDESTVDVSSVVTWTLSDPANWTITTGGFLTVTTTTTSCTPVTDSLTATFPGYATPATASIAYSYGGC